MVLSQKICAIAKGKDAVGAELARGGDELARRQINEMGEDVALGRRHQCGWRVGVDAAGDSGCTGGAVGERGQDLRFAGAAVASQFGEPGSGVSDRAAMGRVVAQRRFHGEPVKASEEGAHVAVGRRDERGRPAHDVIAGEDRGTSGQVGGEAEVIAEMAGRVDRPELPTFALHICAIAKRHVRTEIRVDAFAATDPAALGQCGHGRRTSGRRATEGEDGCAGFPGKPAGEGGMVEMGMGDEDMADPFAGAEGGEDRREMAAMLGPGVDHCDRTLANYVCVGAMQRHRRWIGRKNDAQARLGPLHFARHRMVLPRLRHLALSLVRRRR